MARKSIDQQLAEVNAKRNKLVLLRRKQNRKIDTRRKVLMGAFLLNWLQNSELDEIYIYDWLQNNLPRFLKRDQDKDLLKDILDQINKKRLIRNCLSLQNRFSNY